MQLGTRDRQQWKGAVPGSSISMVTAMATVTAMAAATAPHFGDKGRSCPLRLKSCRDRSDSWCLLYPRKLPRLSLIGASALGH